MKDTIMRSTRKLVKQIMSKVSEITDEEKLNAFLSLLEVMEESKDENEEEEDEDENEEESDDEAEEEDEEEAPKKTAKKSAKSTKKATAKKTTKKAAKDEDEEDETVSIKDMSLSQATDAATKLLTSETAVTDFLKAQKAKDKASKLKALQTLLTKTEKCKTKLAALQKTATKADVKISFGRGRSSDETKQQRAAAQLIAAGEKV